MVENTKELKFKKRLAQAEELLSSANSDNDDEDEETSKIYRPSQKKRSRTISHSSSPKLLAIATSALSPTDNTISLPTTPLTPTAKGRKKANHNPNRTDKAGRTRLFSATTAGHLDIVKDLIRLGADVNARDHAGWTPLHEAALKGQYQIGKYLLDHGAEVNVKGFFSQDTPLHDACSSGSIECVQLLIDAGADVFALNTEEKRPIDLCADNGNRCKQLVQAKMQKLERLFQGDQDGRTLLHIACMDNNPTRVQKLVEKGADVNAKDHQNATPLHLACALGHLDSVKILFEQGAMVDILGTKANDTPLHEAARHGHRDLVEYLVYTAKSDVNMLNERGKSAYDVCAPYPPIRQLLTARIDEVRMEEEACDALDDIAKKTALRNEPGRQPTREQRKIQQYMRVFANLEGGAVTTTATDNKQKSQNSNNQVLDQYGLEPIRTATIRKKRKVSAVRKRTASPDLRKTSHRRSVSSDASSVTAAQLEGGNTTDSTTSPISATTTINNSNQRKSPIKLDPFKKDSTGRTQLHKNAKRGDAEAVEQLLESGANPNETDHAGWTPLHEAALNGQVDVAKVLVKYGADTNAKGADMDTPLHDATENNHYEIVELLLGNGADPFVRNAYDAEPIDIATEHDFQDIILLLQSASPVVIAKKKKRRSTKLENRSVNNKSGLTEVETDSHIPINSTKKKQNSKKRRLIQAVDLEKNKSSDDEVNETDKQVDLKMDRYEKESAMTDTEIQKAEEKIHSIKEESTIEQLPISIIPNDIPNKKSFYSVSTDAGNNNNNIPSPPPDSWSKQKSDAKRYSPIYTVQINHLNPSSPSQLQQQQQQFYVIDLQISLFLGLSLFSLYKTYPNLIHTQLPINREGKTRLWSTLKQMIPEEKSSFIERRLFFVNLDEIVELIKQDFKHLSDHLLTIALDIGYENNERHHQLQQLANKTYRLPSKMALKMKKHSIQVQTYPSMP